MERGLIAAATLSLLVHGALLLSILALFAPCRPIGKGEAVQVIVAHLVSLPGPLHTPPATVTPAPVIPATRPPVTDSAIPNGRQVQGLFERRPEAPDTPMTMPATVEGTRSPSSSPYSSGKGEAVPTAPSAGTAPEPSRGHGRASGRENDAGGAPREVSMGVSGAPRFIRRVEPVYPPIARRLGKEGEVVLRLFLDEGGLLERIEVVRKGNFGFTEAAVDAMRRSVFAPASRDGRPEASLVLVPVRFVLREDRQ